MRRYVVVAAAAGLMIALALVLAWWGREDDGEAELASGSSFPESSPKPKPRRRDEPPPLPTEPKSISDAATAAPAAPAPAPDDRSPGLAGLVLTPDGAPAPDAHVGLFRMAAAPESHAKVATRTDAGGRFELAVPEDRDGAFLLVARSGCFRPASTIVDLAGAGDDVTLRLERGFEIAGLLVRDGHALEDATLRLDLRYGEAGLFGLGEEMFWIDGRVENKLARTRTDESGLFRFEGLGPHEHLVTAETDDGAWSAARSREIHAPASGVVIDVSCALLEVAVTEEGRAVPDAVVKVADLAGGEMRSGTTGSGGRCAISVPLHRDLRLEVLHPAFAPWRAELPPVEGSELQRAVDLVRVDRPTLVINASGLDDTGVAALDVRLHAVETEEPPPGEAELRSDLIARREAHSRFVVPAVPYPPGRYRLLVGPHGSDGASRYLLPAEREIVLPAHDLVEITIDVTQGGRFSCQFEDRHGHEVGASYRLLDAGGREVETGSRTGPGSTGELDVFRIVIAALARGDSTASTGQTWRIHPPGQYTIDVRSDGFKHYRAPLVLRAGQTTAVRIVLEPSTPKEGD